MNDEINRTANWEPGTLEKTRKNIGDISEKEAATMAKKLGGQVMYEKSDNSNPNPNYKNTGRIVRNTTNYQSSSSSSPTQQKIGRYKRNQLQPISKKVASAIDKLMISQEYKIKPNYGIFNFIRNLQKNGTEKINPDFYQYAMKQQIEHLESFITIIKTLIQIAPATYKAKIANGTEAKFKFLRMIASWSMQQIKMEYINLQNAQNPMIVADLIPYTKAIYKQIIQVYYYGTNKIPKLIKEIYNDEAMYPEAPKEKLSNYAKHAITEWLFIDTQIIKKNYPLLMRMCSDTFEPYPTFFNTKVGEILKFLELHKFDLLIPEKQKESTPEEKKTKPAPMQKGVKDSTVITGLKLLNQLFPNAGFDKLDEHPDLYPYFQPLYKFSDGFNMLSPENPVQTITVLHRIIEDCFQGCRNITFVESESQKKGADSISSVLDDWSAYRENTFEKLYCEPLQELVNNIYSQSDFDKSHMGRRLYNSLLWQTTYHYLPNFKFDKLLLEHPADESKYRPLFHRTDFARKYLTLAVNECDSVAKTKGTVKLIENPWEHYNFDIPNEVSKRLDVLLGAQNKGANTNATNANLLKYALCFMAVLDWYLNNPDSPAYTTDPMHVYRISNEDGKPVFSVPERTDQNKLFADEIRKSYQKNAK